MLIASTDSPECPCPNCGAPLDTITGEGEPKEGDFSMCFECFALLRLNADLTVRPLIDEDFDSLDSETQEFLEREKHINMLAKLQCGRMPESQLHLLLDVVPNKDAVITTYYHDGKKFVRYGEYGYSNVEESKAILSDPEINSNMVLLCFNDNTYGFFTRKVH